MTRLKEKLQREPDTPHRAPHTQPTPCTWGQTLKDLLLRALNLQTQDIASNRIVFHHWRSTWLLLQPPHIICSSPTTTAEALTSCLSNTVPIAVQTKAEPHLQFYLSITPPLQCILCFSPWEPNQEPATLQSSAVAAFCIIVTI